MKKSETKEALETLLKTATEPELRAILAFVRAYCGKHKTR